MNRVILAGSIIVGIAVMLSTSTIPSSYGGEIIQVSIDIKPGSDPNSINTNSMGLVPVAILTTADFDATTVDPDTLIFMAVDDLGGGEPNCVRHGIEDVDGDGDLDLVCKFPQKTIWIDCDTTQGAIIGATFGGQSIFGTDSINPVGKDCHNNNNA